MVSARYCAGFVIHSVAPLTGGAGRTVPRLMKQSKVNNPSATYGWASSAGFTIVNAFGMPGDSLGAQAVYSEGAIGYNTVAWGSGNRMG